MCTLYQYNHVYNMLPHTTMCTSYQYNHVYAMLPDFHMYTAVQKYFLIVWMHCCRRMQQVREREKRATVEDLMYASVLEKFMELKVEMLPRYAMHLCLGMRCTDTTLKWN